MPKKGPSATPQQSPRRATIAPGKAPNQTPPPAPEQPKKVATMRGVYGALAVLVLAGTTVALVGRKTTSTHTPDAHTSPATVSQKLPETDHGTLQQKIAEMDAFLAAHPVTIPQKPTPVSLKIENMSAALKTGLLNSEYDLVTAIERDKKLMKKMTETIANACSLKDGEAFRQINPRPLFGQIEQHLITNNVVTRGQLSIEMPRLINRVLIPMGYVLMKEKNGYNIRRISKTTGIKTLNQERETTTPVVKLAGYHASDASAFFDGTIGMVISSDDCEIPNITADLQRRSSNVPWLGVLAQQKFSENGICNIEITHESQHAREFLTAGDTVDQNKKAPIDTVMPPETRRFIANKATEMSVAFINFDECAARGVELVRAAEIGLPESQYATVQTLYTFGEPNDDYRIAHAIMRPLLSTAGIELNDGVDAVQALGQLSLTQKDVTTIGKMLYTICKPGMEAMKKETPQN